MALNIDTQDLVNFPGSTKRITIDLDSVVPIGNEGDEVFVLNAKTSAYSDNVERIGISDLYITDTCAGWIKSSGFSGSGGKFDLDSTHKSLNIKIDATTSGVGNGFYEVTLTPSEDQTPLSGEVVAAELKRVIRDLATSLSPADVGFSGSYRNASVEYKNGKFWIVSGSITGSYVGANRSSVLIEAASSNDCTKELGFDMPISSANLASTAVKETIVSTNYTSDTDTLYVNTGTAAAVGMAFMITDVANSVDYFTALSGTTGAAIKVATESSNGFIGITNDYLAGEAKVQLLKVQDPEGVPTNWYRTVDQLVRYGIKVMSKQIDYSN